MKVTLNELKEVTKQAILKRGYKDGEADAILEVMLYAQLRGNNQGIVKIIGGGLPDPVRDSKMEVLKESKVSAWIDAHRQHSMFVVSKAAEIAAQKAKEHGIAMVGVKGLNASSGALGYYAHQIAEQGLVGIVFASSRGTVAAEGSYEATYGTNPFAIAVPSKNEPIVLDMATAYMAYFGVVEADTAGRALPEGIAYDKQGSLTTDPAKVLDGGALRTFDKGRKSSHLSMMVHLLAGPMVGAAFVGQAEPEDTNDWAGHLVIAIDPDVLAGTDHLRDAVSLITNKVKSSKKLPGVDEILIAGEHGARIAKAALESGEVEIEDKLWDGVKQAAQG